MSNYNSSQVIRKLYQIQGTFVEYSIGWQMIQEAIDYIHRLEYDNKNSDKEIRRLQVENANFRELIDVGNNRVYRKKFIEEIWKKEMGNELSTPDFDYIYQKYFEMRQDRDNWRNNYEYAEHLFPQITKALSERQEAEDE